MGQKLERCPFCSSKTGYKLKEYLWLTGYWGEETRENNSIGTNKYAECLDCGGKVAAGVALGESQ